MAFTETWSDPLIPNLAIVPEDLFHHHLDLTIKSGVYCMVKPSATQMWTFLSAVDDQMSSLSQYQPSTGRVV